MLREIVITELCTLWEGQGCPSAINEGHYIMKQSVCMYVCMYVYTVVLGKTTHS